MDDPRRRRRLLRQHVGTDALLGVDSVPLGEAAAESEIRFSISASIPPEQPARPAMPRSAPAPSAAPAAPPRFAPAPTTTAPTRGAELFAGAPPSIPVMEPIAADRKLAILTELDEKQVRSCTKCKLCESRTQTVFGEGSFDADLMFVGEGPGETEDRLGRPFVGRAGNLLDKMIVAMGLSREQVFIANVVKCRPPGNRTPLADEVAACADFLRTQILTIQPKVIVTLGGPAAKLLLQTDIGITRIRGKWHNLAALFPQGPHIPVMPTFHPAYLLRQYTEDNRRKVWSDLKDVMKLLGQG